jgi:hypothetical protein
MTWWDFQGHQHDGQPPWYDDSNGQDRDTSAGAEDCHWRTRDGKKILISDLEDSHLLNIQRALVTGTAKAPVMMCSIIDGEVQWRGLTPLTPYASQAEAYAVASVSVLYSQWPRLTADERQRMSTVFEGRLPDAVSDDGGAEYLVFSALSSIDMLSTDLDEAAKDRVVNALSRWFARCVQGQERK